MSPGEYGDKTTEDKARNRQREIEHRLRNDFTVTLAASDIAGMEDPDLPALLDGLVSDAMHQIDLLLVEIY